MRGRSYEIASVYRYGYQAQERDDEVYGRGASYYYRYRQQDARLGRFWRVDPLARKYPWNSPYAFAENDVVSSVELEGLEKVKFTLRSYAPFRTFGDISETTFRGDARGPSLSSEASYRIMGGVTYDLGERKIVSMEAGKTISEMIHKGSGAVLKRAESPSKVNVVLPSFHVMRGGLVIRDDFTFRMNISGSNKAFYIPQIALDIDLGGEFYIDRLKENEYFSTFGIRAILVGNVFPNHELILSDEKGTRIWMAHVATKLGENGPYWGLGSIPFWQYKTLQVVGVQVQITHEGQIIGVSQDGEFFLGPEEWNTKFEARFQDQSQEK